MGLNDIAWEMLFQKYNIMDEICRRGRFRITAPQIKEVREPRLMTKFDHKVNLPDIFAEHNLSILPITRGSYIISSFNAYQSFDEPSEDYERISAPLYLQSLNPSFIVSEAVALNYANACGLIEDFLEDERIVPTVNGRMSSGLFQFQIETDVGLRQVRVSNSQIEIDAAYEGVNCLSIFEAKRELADDFIVRQLYYPFRVWTNRIHKQIKSVFLTYSNGIFRLYQYCFEEPGNYNSIQLVKQKNYMIATKIKREDIEKILQEITILVEPAISFPQANSMERIVNLLELLSESGLTKSYITGEYAFDERQTYYYTDACRYLGLVNKLRDESGEICYYLSEKGRQIMSMEYRTRQLSIVAEILKHRPFHEILKMYLLYGEMPAYQTVVQVMKKSDLYRVSADSTYERRASTVTGWVKWIVSLIEE